MKTMLLTVVLFALSVLVRVPNLNQPLGGHNEDAPAHVLVTLTALWHTPIEESHLLPVLTLPGDANVGVDSFPGASAPDAAGRYFYTSFPPALFLVPYAVFRVLNVEPSPLALQVFGLALHLLSALAITWLIKEFVGRWTISALFGAVVILFASENLWAFQNAYWAQTLIFPVWIMAIGWTMRALRSLPYRALMGAAVFALCSIEWSGYVFAAAVMLMAGVGYVRTRERGYAFTALVSITAAALAFGVMAAHFSAFLGAGYWSALSARFAMRSALAGDVLVRVGINYALGYGAFVPVLAIFGWMARHRVRALGESLRSGYVWLAVFPIVENFLLLNHTAFYTFAALKVSVAIALIGAVLIEHLSGNLIKRGMLAGVVLSIGVYALVNPPGLRGDGSAYGDYALIGAAVRNSAEPDETVFTNTSGVRGHLLYYSGRNLVEACGTVTCVDAFLHAHGRERARVFMLSTNHYAIPRVVYNWTSYGWLTGELTYTAGAADFTAAAVYPGKISGGDWENGVSRTRAAIRVHDAGFLAWLRAGMMLEFPGGDVRTITAIEGDQVVVSGGVLDPLTTGYPHRVTIAATRSAIITPKGSI